MAEGRIIKAIAGFYDVESDYKIYRCRARGRFRNTKTSPVVGDYVDFQIENDNQGYVLSIKKRKNLLLRPPIANIDQALLVFSITEPEFDQVLLDRFLAIIEHLLIRPIIIITKIDLDDRKCDEIKRIYHAYDVIFVSNVTQEGIRDIQDLLKDQISVVTGQSGVGKSSLLNALDASLDIATAEISDVLGRGRHTTRHTELIPMYGGYVADTPGFSSLNIDMEPEEFALCYHDFREKAVDCKFRSCLHDQEPYCGVKRAVETGEIDPSRYQHYISILKELKEKKEKRYG